MYNVPYGALARMYTQGDFSDILFSSVNKELTDNSTKSCFQLLLGALDCGSGAAMTGTGREEPITF